MNLNLHLMAFADVNEVCISVELEQVYRWPETGCVYIFHLKFPTTHTILRSIQREPMEQKISFQSISRPIKR